MWDYVWFWISAEIAKAIMALSFIALVSVVYLIYVLIKGAK